jgi:hypothetical protein
MSRKSGSRFSEKDMRHSRKLEHIPIRPNRVGRGPKRQVAAIFDGSVRIEGCELVVLSDRSEKGHSIVLSRVRTLILRSCRPTARAAAKSFCAADISLARVPPLRFLYPDGSRHRPPRDVRGKLIGVRDR